MGTAASRRGAADGDSALAQSRLETLAALRPLNGTRSREKQESAIGEQGSNTATTFDFLFESFAKDRSTGYPSAARAITHS